MARKTKNIRHVAKRRARSTAAVSSQTKPLSGKMDQDELITMAITALAATSAAISSMSIIMVAHGHAQAIAFRTISKPSRSKRFRRPSVRSDYRKVPLDSVDDINSDDEEYQPEHETIATTDELIRVEQDVRGRDKQKRL